MNQVRDHKPKRIRAARNQGARRQVWAVVQLFHALQNALASLLADIAVIAQNFGNSDHGDPEVASDIFHPNRHKLSLCRPEFNAIESAHEQEQQPPPDVGVQVCQNNGMFGRRYQ